MSLCVYVSGVNCNNIAFNYGDSAEFRIDELDLGAVPSISTQENSSK